MMVRERDTMDRSRGVITAPKVQVRQLTQQRDNCETLHIGKAPLPRCPWVKLFTELKKCRSQHATSDAGSGTKTA